MCRVSVCILESVSPTCSCVLRVCVYARVSALTFEFYFISREQLAYIAGRVTPSWKTVETRWKISQIRRPRGDSIDAHVSLTRSMPRATLSMTLSLFFSSFLPFSSPLSHGNNGVPLRRGGNNDATIDRIKYLKR